MVLKLTTKQSAKVRNLARRKCCNCVDGNCLLFDDGEAHPCVQMLSVSGIYCCYFKEAVLPADRELYAEIIEYNKERKERNEGSRKYEDHWH